MRIEIVNKEGDLITDFELEANPFKVGEMLNVKVSNYNKKFWTASEVSGDYIVNKIEHFLRKDYTLTEKISIVFSVSVEVSPVNLLPPTLKHWRRRGFETKMFSSCTMLNSSTNVQFTTSSPFFANAMLCDVAFRFGVSK